MRTQDSHQPQIVEPHCLVDVLGVALLMAGPDLGVHVSSLVENITLTHHAMF